MTSVSLLMSEESMNRYMKFENRIKELGDKLEGILQIEQRPSRKLNVKRYIDSYFREVRSHERDRDGHHLLYDLMQQVEQSEDKTKYEEYVKRKIIINRSVNLDEINSHKAKYEEIKRRFAYQKHLEKMHREKDIKDTNDKLSTSVEYTKRQLEKYKKTEENEEREKIEHAVKNLKKNEFSHIVSEYFKPLNSPKPTYNIQNNNKNEKIRKSWNPHHKKSASISPVHKKETIIKTPLLKKPDYLLEMRKNKDANSNQPRPEKKWENMLRVDEKYDSKNIYNQIKDVKMKADMLENKAKMEEKILKAAGGLVNYPEKGVKMSEMLIESMKAKLAILNKMNKL
jgi:hypothetical protein